MTPSLLRMRAANYRRLAISWRIVCELTLARIFELRADRCEVAAIALEAAEARA